MKWSNKRIVDEVRRIAIEIGYPVPEVQISDRMIKRFGKTDPADNIVRLNKRFIELNSRSVIKALIIHELVHLKFPDHGYGFKNEMNRLGYGKHIMKGFTVKIEKYTYECGVCGIIHDNRRLVNAVCRKCGGKVESKGKDVVKVF